MVETTPIQNQSDAQNQSSTSPETTVPIVDTSNIEEQNKEDLRNDLSTQRIFNKKIVANFRIGQKNFTADPINGELGDLVYVNTVFKICTTASASGSAVYSAVDSPSITDAVDIQVKTSNGNWTKPANVTSNSMVLVQLWGGGAGGGTSGTLGASAGGGGGGAYVEVWFRASDLSSTCFCTIGAGGAADNPGGTTNFFSGLVFAYGGGIGVNNASGGGGGGGGGSLGVGSNGSGTTGGAGGPPGGGTASNAGFSGGGGTNANGGNATDGGGGGGSGIASGPGRIGGSSIRGGGGGGGGSPDNSGGVGGPSVMGGSGGGGGSNGVGSDGNTPGGGGGGGGSNTGVARAGGAGARGEIRVITFI